MSNLKQLAKSLDLSITTVSRALDGYSDVAATTRLRVRAAADEIGYRPNAAARRLRRRRAEVVAVTLPAASGHLAPPAFLDMLSGCAEKLAEQNLNLVLAPTPRGMNELEICRRLVDGQRVEAMIVMRTRCDDERVTFLQSRGIPFVTHGRTDAAVPHAFFDGDGESAFREAALRLAEAGHRRIAHIAGPHDLTFARLRRRGWQTALADAGLDPSFLAEAAPDERGGYEAAQMLLAGHRRPTAFLCAMDAIAIGAMHALRERGLEPGRDVAVIGHDNVPAGAFMRPALSTMQIAGDGGLRLASLLLERIGGRAAAELQEIAPVAFVPRETHGWDERPARS